MLRTRSAKACTTYRDKSPISGIPWFSKTFVILGIPKVSFYACPEKGWGSAVESSVLTTYIPMGLDSAVNSSRQTAEACNWNWDCLLWEWGRTGLAISGVFGAGKTRSAAALQVGLLVFKPSLQLMVLGAGSEVPPSEAPFKGAWRVWGRGGGVSCFYSFGEPLTDGLTQCLCLDRTLLYSWSMPQTCVFWQRLAQDLALATSHRKRALADLRCW